MLRAARVAAEPGSLGREWIFCGWKLLEETWGGRRLPVSWDISASPPSAPGHRTMAKEKTWTLNKKLGRCGLSDSAHVLMLAGKKNEQNPEQPKLPLKIQYIESRLRNQEC